MIKSLDLLTQLDLIKKDTESFHYRRPKGKPRFTSRKELFGKITAPNVLETS